MKITEKQGWYCTTSWACRCSAGHPTSVRPSKHRQDDDDEVNVKVLIQIAEKRGLNVAIVTESYPAADKVGWTNAKECRRLSMSF